MNPEKLDSPGGSDKNHFEITAGIIGKESGNE
jgi:hypothetical protein